MVNLKITSWIFDFLFISCFWKKPTSDCNVFENDWYRYKNKSSTNSLIVEDFLPRNHSIRYYQVWNMAIDLFFFNFMARIFQTANVWCVLMLFHHPIRREYFDKLELHFDQNYSPVIKLQLTVFEHCNFWELSYDKELL